MLTLPDTVTAISPGVGGLVIQPRKYEVYIAARELIPAKELVRGMILHRLDTDYIIQILRVNEPGPILWRKYIGEDCTWVPGQGRYVAVVQYEREIKNKNITVIAKLMDVRAWIKSEYPHAVYNDSAG